MVQDKKTRSGHIIDNGSPTRGTSDSERPADQSYQGISSARQAESQIIYRAKAGVARLNAAVLAQAAKDLCSSKQESIDKIIEWTSTDMFREVCGITGFDHEETSAKLRKIADMPLRIRRDLVHSLIEAARRV